MTATPSAAPARAQAVAENALCPIGGRIETRIGAATTAHHGHRHEERSGDPYQEDEGREDDRDKDVRIHRSRAPPQMRTPLPAQTIDPFMSRSFLLLPASPSARGRAIGKRHHFEGGSPPRRLVLLNQISAAASCPSRSLAVPECGLPPQRRRLAAGLGPTHSAVCRDICSGWLGRRNPGNEAVAL